MQLSAAVVNNFSLVFFFFIVSKVQFWYCFQMSKWSNRFLCPGIPRIIDLVPGDCCTLPKGWAPNEVSPECNRLHSLVRASVCLLSSGWGKWGRFFHLTLIGPWNVVICFSCLSSYLLGLTVREMFNFQCVSSYPKDQSTEIGEFPCTPSLQNDHF